MSHLTGRLRSGGACGGALEEDEGCGGGLEGPEGWTGEGRPLEPGDGASVNYDLIPPTTLANGLHRTLGLSTRRRRQLDTLMHTYPDTQTHTLAQTPLSTQDNMDTAVHSRPPKTNALSKTHTDSQADVVTHTSPPAAPGQPRAAPPSDTHTSSPQTQPLPLVNQPLSTNQMPASVPCSPPLPLPSAETDTLPGCSPVSIGQTPPGPSPLPVEGERKYALRSSGRPRFPCHLRKSSRLRRNTEDVERRAGRDRGEEEADEEESEEKIWNVKKEEEVEEVVVLRGAAEVPSAASSVPDTAAPRPAPHHPPARPAPHHPPARPSPHSLPGRLQPSPMPRPRPRPRPQPRPLPAVKKVEPVAVEVSPPPKKRRGRFVGVRKIVVKVARIPVNLSRRQKSYKISSMETVTGADKGGVGGDGGPEGPEGGPVVVREPTALLRMKNNGKSVMVMFPPGELPVILKRRRGRPPKQAVPGGADARNSGNAVGNADQPKKPRRKRRTKLPSPQPSYVNDTNDIKAEYGDVLSKLAFLNRQPPATGRCSPPRCWTPSEPDSFHAPLENPGISTLLHRLTGFRRRGGRGGGVGSRGGGVGGGAGGAEGFKSSFCDFFETIGKKRKPTPPGVEPGLPRKRGKGAGGGAGGRGGGVAGDGGVGEKPVRKRRSRKNGTFKGEGAAGGQDWANGGGGWGEEGFGQKDRGPGGFQSCGSPGRGFLSCEGGRGGVYGSPGSGKVARASAEEAQGLFAGYFRSLLDSDDSSDLLDISMSSPASSRPDTRKPPNAAGYESSSPAPGPSWSPAFPKRSPKGPGLDSPAQPQCSSARPPYSYSLAQTSPTTSSFSKSTPPSLSLSRSPSSPHPSSYCHYPSSYSSSSPGGGSVGSQRPTDCSFSYGAGHSSTKATPVGQGQMGYSSYQAASKRGYSGYPGSAHSSLLRGETAAPTSPGAGYMAMAKSSSFPCSSSPEGYRHPSNQWNYRQGYASWGTDGFGLQYNSYNEYAGSSTESKDILDISNYTPQKAKRPSFPESLSESSSDSSHLGSAATCGGSGSGGGIFRQKEPVPIGEAGQSSLSSLEKLMMDWHESAAGPSYNWSQNVLFQGGGNKQGRGRRKRSELQGEREGGSATAGGPPDSPSSPLPSQGPGPKISGVGGRQPRGSRGGGRGGLSPCQRERPAAAKAKAKGASGAGASGGGGSGGGASGGGASGGSGLFQEGLDYYSGDSSSLSPLPTSAPPHSYPSDPCEYPSPYSAHPSTPSSDERYPAIFPGESSLSPSMSSYPPKPTPPPPQTYHPVPTRTFSPSCSPSPRLPPHCGTALSPPHRAPPKDPQYPQYDSPNYCGSPYWYGQASHGGSPNPHAHTSTHANPHASAHVSPHGNAHTNPHANSHSNPNPHANTHQHPNAQPHANLSPHTNPASNPNHPSNPHSHPSTTLHGSVANPHHHPLHPNNHHHHHAQSHPHPHPNTHANPHLHSNPTSSLHTHPNPLHYEERPPPSGMPHHKRDLAAHMTSGSRLQAPILHSPYPSPLHKPSLEAVAHSEDMGYSPLPLHSSSYPGMPSRYPPQPARGGGVLCQLLDPPTDDSFSVTSL
ncbi:AT-hook DNA-binding motif-containing protein 1 [Hypomesus transpacificus]|uniref:AT-hook DNA-binding motif-containing protein 1 n=1 Tax=Hypomesus transpacificus TaxID=137520 RepID=UPI001F07A9A8|nr:AT-hook DNA-binding motif-containing protein 1 [Hypomesus transpacificus]